MDCLAEPASVWLWYTISTLENWKFFFMDLTTFVRSWELKILFHGSDHFCSNSILEFILNNGPAVKLKWQKVIQIAINDQFSYDEREAISLSLIQSNLVFQVLHKISLPFRVDTKSILLSIRWVSVLEVFWSLGRNHSWKKSSKK